MAISIIMPALEMAQDTGKLLSWRKKEGERVSKGEPLLEIETDKAVVEIESPGEGILAGILAREGAVIPVGQTIAWLVQPGEAPPAADKAPSASAASTPAAATTTAASRPAVSSAGQPATAPAAAGMSPKARRLAQEQGVDLGRVRGSGAGGEILAADVLAAAASQVGSASSGAAEIETPGQVGRLMAERTAQSWTTVPHFFVVREIDAGALVGLREELVPAIEKSHGLKVTHTDLLVALVARVLVKHPRLNASWTGQAIRRNSEINIGIAIAVEDGVVTTVIRGADKAALGDIAVQRRDTAERARAGKPRPSDITGGTFTISNLGMYRVDAFSAIIVQPQAAILAVGAIADRVVAVAGRPEVRPMITLTLSSDHRVADGARAAMFMQDLAEAVRDPKKWLG
jgi:pyruvate dehydrogenase E2 component (dihydrolipoamide acetyltransferase)